jgi:hypothetical protein
LVWDLRRWCTTLGILPTYLHTLWFGRNAIENLPLAAITTKVWIATRLQVDSSRPVTDNLRKKMMMIQTYQLRRVTTQRAHKQSTVTSSNPKTAEYPSVTRRKPQTVCPTSLKASCNGGTDTPDSAVMVGEWFRATATLLCPPPFPPRTLRLPTLQRRGEESERERTHRGRSRWAGHTTRWQVGTHAGKQSKAGKQGKKVPTLPSQQDLARSGCSKVCH